MSKNWSTDRCIEEVYKKLEILEYYKNELQARIRRADKPNSEEFHDLIFYTNE